MKTPRPKTNDQAYLNTTKYAPESTNIMKKHKNKKHQEKNRIIQNNLRTLM